MPLLDFLDPKAVLPALRVSGKKQALQELRPIRQDCINLDEGLIFEALLQRERLAPRVSARAWRSRTASFRASTRIFGLVARLEKPIDFEALDGQHVDILFLLLAPEGAGADHLKALARVARVLREPASSIESAPPGRRRRSTR